MIEVFKTDVKKNKQAKSVIKHLRQKFPHFRVNFDLEDCDNILRVENLDGQIDNGRLIDFANEIGIYIEALVDEPSANKQSTPNGVQTHCRLNG